MAQYDMTGLRYLLDFLEHMHYYILLLSFNLRIASRVQTVQELFLAIFSQLTQWLTARVRI